MATVSFLSNAGGPLSFPYGHPVANQPEGLDEDAITARLRGEPPALLAAPVASASGPATLLSSYALSAVGDVLDDAGLSPLAAIADFSLRARRRGFVNVAEPSTYCAHLFDGSGSPAAAAEIGPEGRDWLIERHPYLAAAEQESVAPESPLAIAHRTAPAKVLGVRVLVDGSCLGRREMGTQVQTVALINALAASDDVDRVAVSLANDPPAYAMAALAHPKVEARRAGLGEASVFGAVDVVHRPFQPDGPLDVDAWRGVGRRTALTVLDLISYRSPAYHPSVEGWQWPTGGRWRPRSGGWTPSSRPRTTSTCRSAPNGCPSTRPRLWTAELGTDHLGGDEAATIPPALLERGYAAGRFVLVMGANYAHKNRDIALATLAELRAAGRRRRPRRRRRRRAVRLLPDRRGRRRRRRTGLHPPRPEGRGAQLAAAPRLPRAVPDLRRGLRAGAQRGGPLRHAHRLRADRPARRDLRRPSRHRRRLEPGLDGPARPSSCSPTPPSARPRSKPSWPPAPATRGRRRRPSWSTSTARSSRSRPGSEMLSSHG